MPPQDAEIVDIFSRKSLSRKARKAEVETAAVVDGTVVDHPITILAHLKGEDDPFPRKWQWGKFVLDGSRPSWHRLRLKESSESIIIPDDAVTTGPARPILRAELSAFCPHPRKALIIPMRSGGQNFWVGVPRHSVGTMLAAIARSRQQPPANASPGGG